ncbi:MULTISPECIES: hypothetical protein [Sphingomonas]|uniref:hypothetical protein n=1 Tax=Sphingomonas TaxID=13687 RepID=UPI00126A25B8|nr:MULTISPECIES: hypothetical protein [Sphingomonas]
MPVFGVRRLFVSFLLSGLASAAAAQSSPVAPPPPPRADTVGPEQLRNFALPGSSQEQPATDTRPATTTPTRPARAATTTLPPASRERTTLVPPPIAGTGRAAAPASRPAETVSVALPRTQAPAAATTVSTATTPALSSAAPTGTALPTAPLFPGSDSSVPVSTAPIPATTEEPASNWLTTWLPILALVAAGGLFAWWWPRRKRAGADEGFGQLAFAGGPAALSPEPVRAPAPRPVPAPQPEAPVRAPSVGLVSSRLRAWLDVDLGVRVAAITDEEYSLEIDIVLTNSGSAAAREIAVEALLINAGPDQEQEVKAFFARPDADGFAAETVAPMGQTAFSATLKMPRGAFREYAVGGGSVVVPIVALNTGYKAGSSRGRSSAAFLVGRAGADADKLGPFPTDQGPKGFNRLGLKRLPDQVRR